MCEERMIISITSSFPFIVFRSKVWQPCCEGKCMVAGAQALRYHQSTGTLVRQQQQCTTPKSKLWMMKNSTKLCSRVVWCQPKRGHNMYAAASTVYKSGCSNQLWGQHNCLTTDHHDDMKCCRRDRSTSESERSTCCNSGATVPW